MPRAARITLILGLVGFALLWTGCGASSPRFGKAPPGRTEERRSSDRPRFASKEAEEERREDDRPLDRNEIESVTSGKRTFKTERNEAIAPLDRSRLMREISRYMGVPYRNGGSDQSGMDCSGYTMIVYRNAIGRDLPRTSAAQAAVGTPVRLEDLKFGDLLFFNTTGAPASHVGIYLGDDLFAHASVSLGVTVSSLESSYFKKRYEGARRIVGD